MIFTFRDIVWCSIITLAILFLSKCHRDQKDNLSINIDQLIEKAHKDSITFAKQSQIQEYKVENAQQQIILFTARNKVIENQLDSTTIIATKLAEAIKKKKYPGIDTGTITVDHNYVINCDSLAGVTDQLTFSFNTYRKNQTSILAAKDTIIKGQELLLSIERSAKQVCLRDYNALMALCRNIENSAKPRNQVYVGAELLANSNYLINNVGIALSLKTKSNKLWQVSGGIQSNGGYYARVNGNILIKLK